MGPSDAYFLPAKRRSVFPLGLQGRLIASFMVLLMLGLEADGFLYAHETNQRLVELLGEQARQIAYGLSLASQPALASGQTAGLGEIGQDILRTRNVLFVVFYDPDYQPISISNRDPNSRPLKLMNKSARPAALMQIRQGNSPLLGDYVEVLAPVLGHWQTATQPAMVYSNDSAGQRVLGYVSVGVSQTPEQAQLCRINILAGMISGAVLLATLPLIFLIVHRIFRPIRHLVLATNKIAAGSYDTQVDVDRYDAIGTLARSFNHMAKTVKRQQDDLAQANRLLDQRLERAMADLKDKNAQLEELAATDPLTGLYNRRHFGRVLEQLFSESSRYGDDLACVMIDLDEYKPINDSYGHAVGDQLLIIAGKVISANMRRMDVAARYGGDEFVLLLPRAGGTEAALLVERIRAEYATASAAVLNRPQGVTMSVGIAALLANRPARPDQLVIQADGALYRAKAMGRNRSIVIDAPAPATGRERQADVTTCP